MEFATMLCFFLTATTLYFMIRVIKLEIDSFRVKDKLSGLTHAYKKMAEDFLKTTVSHDELVKKMEELKQVEQRIKDSEQRLNLALDSAQMGAWDLDLISDTAIRSLRHDQIFGYSSLQPQWGAKIFLNHVAPEDRERVMKNFEEAYQTDHFHMECRVIWPDQSLHWIMAQGHVHRNDNGDPIRMLGVVMDTTESKRNEEIIFEKTEELERFNEELEVFNRVAVGREERMIELKDQINQLSKDLGRQPPYDLSFLESEKKV